MSYSYGDISTSDNLVAILDFWYTSMSYDIGNITTKQRDPKMYGSRRNFLAMCTRTRDMSGGILPPPPVAGKRRKKPLPGEGLILKLLMHACERDKQGTVGVQ